MKIPSTHRHFVYSHACDYPPMYMYIHTHIQINKCHAHAHAKTSPLLSNICALYLVKWNTQNNRRQGELLWAIKQHSNWQYCARFWDNNSKVAKYDYICLRALYNHNSLSGNGNKAQMHWKEMKNIAQESPKSEVTISITTPTILFSNL